MNGRSPVQRSWLEVRWRRLRNPPPPVVRAILANLGLATVGGALLLVADFVVPPDMIALLIAAFLLLVVVGGSLLTYLWVELPTGASGVRRRSPWAALLGLFASLPICYIVLVVVFQVIRPLIG